MSFQRFVAAALAGFPLLAGAQAEASTLFSQPTDANSAFASQNDTIGGLGNFATVFDDFSLGTGATVGSVKFIGSYFDPPNQGTITGFTVKIYDDNAGPNAVLFTETVAGAAGETSLGTDNSGDPYFEYSVTLTGGFAASRGTTYWLSVVPDLGFPPQWGWESAGNGAAFQDFFGSREAIDSNLAFELDGTINAVPEPSTLALLSAGLAGLGAARRRRQPKT